MFRDSSLLIYDPSSRSSPILERRGVDIEPFVSKDVREMTVDDSVLQLELNMTPSTRTLGTPLWGKVYITDRQGLNSSFSLVSTSHWNSPKGCVIVQKTAPHNVLLIIGFSFEHTVMFYTLEGSITVGQSIETSVFLWRWHMYHLSSLSKIRFFMHKKDMYLL